MLSLRTAVAAALLSLTLACGSGLEQQESSYKDRQAKLVELAAKAAPSTKTEITAKHDDIAKRYAALPKDGARGDGLGKLCQELKAALDTYEPRVEAESKGAAAADFASSLKELAGHWKGDGVDMTIGTDASFAYEKKSANTSKSFSGKITKVTPTSFEGSTLGISSTFKIDKRPYDEGGKKLIVIDGTPLTRVD